MCLQTADTGGKEEAAVHPSDLQRRQTSTERKNKEKLNTHSRERQPLSTAGEPAGSDTTPIPSLSAGTWEVGTAIWSAGL